MIDQRKDHRGVWIYRFYCKINDANAILEGDAEQWTSVVRELTDEQNDLSILLVSRSRRAKGWREVYRPVPPSYDGSGFVAKIPLERHEEGLMESIEWIEDMMGENQEPCYMKYIKEAVDKDEKHE